MNKSMKPMKPIARQMTEDERLAQRAQIYLQKKESYALNAALKMLERCEETPSKMEIETIIDKSVFFAETLLEKLFLNKEQEAENENTEGGDNEED